MSLPSLETLRPYLRVQNLVEDSLLEGLLLSAQAAVTGWIGKPIKAEKRTFQVHTNSESFGLYSRRLAVPIAPIGTIFSLTGSDGAAVALSDLYINYRTGLLQYKDGARWMNSPYTITCEVGLECYDEYLNSIEPAINQAIIDIASDLYQRRNPSASSEKEGGGIEVQYSDQTRGVGADNRREDLITPRVAAMLATWRTIGA